MAWCFEDEAHPRADAVLGGLTNQEAVVPSIWPLEVANVLAICQRRGRIVPAEMTRFLGCSTSCSIAVDCETAFALSAKSVACPHRGTVGL